MNPTLQALINKYGVEKIISMLMEQLRISHCKDEEVKSTVKSLLIDKESDTEYIYTLLEYSNLVSYVSKDCELSDGDWKEPEFKEELIKEWGD